MAYGLEVRGATEDLEHCVCYNCAIILSSYAYLCHIKWQIKITILHGYFESFDPRFRDGLLSNLSTWNDWQSFEKNEQISM